MNGHPQVRNLAILNWKECEWRKILVLQSCLAELQNMWQKVQNDQGLEGKLENKCRKAYYIKPWGSAPYLYNKECLQNKQPAQQTYD